MIAIANLLLIAICFVEFAGPFWMRIMAAAVVVLGLVSVMLRLPVKTNSNVP